MKNFLIILALLFVVVLFISCNPDMSGKLTGSWVYSTGTGGYKYTFTEKTFKYEMDIGSGYFEYGNGTFSATNDRLIFDWDQIYSSSGLVTSFRKIESGYGISTSELLFSEGLGNTLIIVGGNVETLVGKWKMYSFFKDVAGVKAYMELSIEIDFDFKSDGTFTISKTLPENTATGKWAIDGDKLTFSEMAYTPEDNNTIADIIQNNDYTFKVVGNAVGIVLGHGSGQTVRVFEKEID